MRLIHTADWHLNDRLGRVDRTADLRERVERVAALCDEYAADVLLIAGDLFAESATTDQVADSLRHLEATFSGFFARGGTILAVTGNHDQDRRVRRELEVARAGMLVAAPSVRPGEGFRPGRLYLLGGTFFGKLRDPRDDFDVQFVFLPYPSPSCYLDGDGAFTTAEEQNRLVQGAVAAWLRSLPGREGYDPAARTVLAGHLNVEGADLGRGLFRLHERDDVTLPAPDLPVAFDYIALGHIHKAQCLRGQEHVRYAGSLDRLDFGERDESKGVVLVEIGPDGRRGEPVVLPIDPTPLVELVIREPELDADALRTLVPDPARAVVKVIAEPAVAGDTGEALKRFLHAALPRIAAEDWQAAPIADGPADRAVPARADFRSTVRDYLARRLADDSRRDELLRLADSFLDPEAQP